MHRLQPMRAAAKVDLVEVEVELDSVGESCSVFG